MMMMRVIEQLQKMMMMMMKHLLLDYQVVMGVGGSQTGVLSKILLVPVVVAMTVVQVMKEVVEVDVLQR